jgi:hypothetical protein
MTTTRTSGATALAVALLLGAAPVAVAQSATEDLHHPETGPQAEQSRPMTPGSGPAQGMMMMDPQIMQEMMRQMMAQGMMGQGMGPGMMQQMPGMMGQGLTGRMPGHGALGGWRVTPVLHLGVEDVQHSLEHFIEVHELQHLKVGEVRETDDDTITADIVTQEGSLALQLEVDRHTGLVRRVG